ncbi:TPA: restriction endonuclease subunit S [Vibrio parahaemolyticus]|nr:restriction endonuclease subunit S [Vibrio vulnificus]HBK3331388.1 restriction endonuclease subunit S [Vibrio parahaemolyticus]HDY7569857.1 restriction endonuclease subunit S [Vibrio vulnificus]
MAVENLITEHIDIWTSAVKTRSTSGRGSSKKLELYGVKKLRELIFELAGKGMLVDSDETKYDFLENLAELVMGQAPPGRDCNKNGHGTIFVKTGEFGELYPVVQEWTTKPLKESRVGDILICVVGATIGKLNLGIDCAIGRSVAAIRPNSKLLETKYLYYAMHPFTKRVRMQSKGSAQGVIGKSVLNKVKIRVPNLDEQFAIVAKVDELMALCDQLEQQTEVSIEAHQVLVTTLLDTLTYSADADELMQNWARISEHFDTLFTTEESIDQLKQTILQLAVMGKLVPQDPSDEPAAELLKRIAEEKAQLVKEKKIKKQKELPPISEDEKPFELPNGWEWCRLPDLGELARGKSKHRPRNDPKLYENGNIPLVQTGDVARANGTILTYTAKYNEFGLAQSQLWPKGTLCITIAANIADTATLGFDACFPDSVVGYTPYDKEIPTVYFDYFIKTAKENLERFAPSTAQKNINLEILSNVLVPCPPMQQFPRIVEKVNLLLGICDELKERLKESQMSQLQLTDAIVEQAV